MRHEKILLSILFTGMIAGLLFSISLKTDEDVNPESQLIKIGKLICQQIDDPEFSSTCWFNFLLMEFGIFLVGIIEIAQTIEKAGDWMIGALIYGAGFIFGLILSLGV